MENSYVPEIYVGENGNWFVNGYDTGTKAQGESGKDGITPHIGADGFWYIGENSTGVKAQGDVGPKGDKGADGAPGLPGEKGEPGPKGDAGQVGSVGPIGEQGKAGEKGEQGERGLQGEKGAAGPEGPQGAKGDTGSTGAQGIQGIRGDKGDAGNIGPQGPTGLQGMTGPKGDTGVAGPQGTQGIQGPKGDTGAQGSQGPKGDTGATGNGIVVADVSYQSGTSGTVVPTGTWLSSVPQVFEGEFLWSKTVMKFTNNKEITAYSVAKRGDSGIIVSASVPKTPEVGQLWQSMQGKPVKRWTGTEWTIHKFHADNITAAMLSEIAPSLGKLTGSFSENITVPSGETVKVNGTIDVNNGLISATYSGGDWEGDFTVEPNKIAGNIRPNGMRRYGYSIGFDGIYLSEGAKSATITANDLRDLLNVRTL